MKHIMVIDQASVTPEGDTLGIRNCCIFDDGAEHRDNPLFQAAWNGFLRLYNFYQFLPFSYFITTDGVQNKAYEGLEFYEMPDVMGGGVSDETGGKDDALTAAKEWCDEAYHGLLDILFKGKWPLPETGYELQGNDGEIIASGEMAWEDLKLVFLSKIEWEQGRHFIAAGWEIIPIEDVIADPDNYMHLKDKAGE